MTSYPLLFPLSVPFPFSTDTRYSNPFSSLPCPFKPVPTRLCYHRDAWICMQRCEHVCVSQACSCATCLRPSLITLTMLHSRNSAITPTHANWLASSPCTRCETFHVCEIGVCWTLVYTHIHTQLLSFSASSNAEIIRDENAKTRRLRVNNEQVSR